MRTGTARSQPGCLYEPVWDIWASPETVKERVHLRTLGEVFPYGRATGRTVDMDHPRPLPDDPLGPPGRIGDHNAGPLSRTPHRAKTHLGYRVTQPRLTEYVWSTPQGLHRLVDEHGTHPFTAEDAELLTDLPDTVDEEWFAAWGDAIDKLIEQRRTDAVR